MAPAQSDSVIELSLLATDAAPAPPVVVEQQLLLLFDRFGSQLLRYVASFGLSAVDAEDIVQDVFLALFRHLRLGRAQTNLRGWLFQVAHNLALKRRRKLRRLQHHVCRDDAALALSVDPDLSPEARLAQSQRQRRLASVVRALPDRERQCLFLRAEGLRYREIAKALGISLGAVAKSMARAVTRIVSADGR